MFTPCSTNVLSDVLRDSARPAYWIPDADITECCVCKSAFGPKLGIHHCRCCGQGVCAECSPDLRAVPSRGWDYPVRVCKSCHQRRGDLWSTAVRLKPWQKMLANGKAADSMSPQNCVIAWWQGMIVVIGTAPYLQNGVLCLLSLHLLSSTWAFLNSLSPSSHWPPILLITVNLIPYRDNWTTRFSLLCSFLHLVFSIYRKTISKIGVNFVIGIGL